jgi:hypothetical protein
MLQEYEGFRELLPVYSIPVVVSQRFHPGFGPLSWCLPTLFQTSMPHSVLNELGIADRNFFFFISASSVRLSLSISPASDLAIESPVLYILTLARHHPFHRKLHLSLCKCS